MKTILAKLIISLLDPFSFSILIGLLCAFAVISWMWAKGDSFGMMALVGLTVCLVGFQVSQLAIKKTGNIIQHWVKKAASKTGEPVILDTGKDSYILHVGVSADGKTAYTINYYSGGDISIWDTETGQERWKLKGEVRHAAISPSGQLLAVSMADQWGKNPRSLQIFNSSNGELLATLKNPLGLEMVFSHKGSYLLLSSNKENEDVQLYALADMDIAAANSNANPKEIEPIVIPSQIEFKSHRFRNVKFSADDDSIFLLSLDTHTLEHWSIATQPTLLSSVDLFKSIGMSVDKLSDDGSLAFDCGDSSIRISPADAALRSEILHIEVPSMKRPPGSYSEKVFCETSPDQEWIALGINETSGQIKYIYTVNLWKTDGTPAMGDTVPEPVTANGNMTAPQISGLLFSPDSRYLYTTDDQNNLRIYALGPSIKVALIPAAQLGVPMTLPLLSSSDRGILISSHGGTKAVWVPVPHNQ